VLFGLEFLTVPILLGIIVAVLSVARFVYVLFFSQSAKWQVLHDWVTRTTAQEQAERERQAAEDAAIAARPPLAGEELTEALNQRFGAWHRARAYLPRERWWWVTAWAGVAALLLMGCSRHVIREPGLTMPHRPPMTWVRCQPGYQCLNDADADQLVRYLDRLDGFEAARERLLQESLPRQ